MATFHPSWQPLFDQYGFDVDSLYDAVLDVYPPREHLFRVFEMDVKEIRVLLLGQDPYHGPGQAHGLSFSVPTGVPIPPSLRNMYKELQSEFPERNYIFSSGNLEPWFYREKIFLLNASLTVMRASPGSMMGDWEEFTDDVIKFVSENNSTCIFLLLGKFAKAKEVFIKNKANIVTGVHPSPMAAQYGFFGSNIFKQVEAKLGSPINWSVEPTVKQFG
jgi:uracil-DNA glycosylase